MVNGKRVLMMVRRGVGAGLLAGLMSCGASDAPNADLGLVVNGEAFAEAGMLSKDGWQMTFDQVTVTVGKVVVSGIPSEVEGDEVVEVPWSLKEEAEGPPVGFATVSLQDGPATVGEQQVPVGNYNQVKWQWGAESMAAIALKGVAVKGDQSVPFDLQLPGRFQVACGDYVGEERKGIVTADAGGEVELTLHLDHMFGDGTSPPTEEINTQSLGFDALAATATDEGVTVTPENWEEWGAPALRQSIQEVLISMPHVGEGHCEVEG